LKKEEAENFINNKITETNFETKNKISQNEEINFDNYSNKKKELFENKKLEINDVINLNIQNEIPKLKDLTENMKIAREILESKDLFYVRNYIIRKNLMSGLSSKDLKFIKKRFNYLHYAFDTKVIIDEYIFSSNKKLACLICKKIFISPFEVIQNLECKGESYHPKYFFYSKNEKMICSHENCKKKINKGEYPCCHKILNSNGCLLGDGKHHLIINDNINISN